jgi:ubiquinone/menaquinone biosynthesis C-methylase UbiE
MAARYDGRAEWYDQLNAGWSAGNFGPLAEILGPGEGLCLDLGCGTGQYLETLRATGRSVVGLDYSRDQLSIARTRADGGPLVQADAAALPFADATFPTIAILWISTDVDDFAAVLREAARVLCPGGVLVFYGAHPCFNGPHIGYRDDGGRTVHPTYRQAGWHQPASWWREGGVRGSVGMRQTPLAEFLNAFYAAGLTITRVVEPGDDPVPGILALRTEKGP